MRVKTELSVSDSYLHQKKIFKLYSCLRLLFSPCPPGGAVRQPGGGRAPFRPPAAHQQGPGGALRLPAPAWGRGAAGGRGGGRPGAGGCHRVEARDGHPDGACEKRPKNSRRRPTAAVCELPCFHVFSLFLFVSRLQQRHKSDFNSVWTESKSKMEASGGGGGGGGSHQDSLVLLDPGEGTHIRRVLVLIDLFS